MLPDTNTTYMNTMPIGNVDVAANVWTDGVATVSLLLSSAHAWNEGSQLYKLARVDVTFSPAPDATPFLQELDLATGAITITIGALTIEVWADANGNAIVVSHTPSYTANYTVTLLRPEETVYAGPFECEANYSISADVTMQTPTGVVMYHRNEEGFKGQNYFKDAVADQNLGDAAYASQPNVLFNRTSGVHVASSGDSVVITALTKQTQTAQQFVDDLESSVVVPNKVAHDAWWLAFWTQSRIEVGEQSVATKYFLQRYLQACQARAPYPLKFNGMIFTAQKGDQVDYRQWGGRNWWQNARLSYYNMFASGDLTMVDAFLQSYLRTLPLATARAAHYFNVSGAYWEEYADANFGTQNSKSYGCGRRAQQTTTTAEPYWYNEDRWNHYNSQGSLDLSLFALDYHAYTGDDKYLEIAAAVVEYFGQYRPRNAEGKLVIYPTQALETYQCPDYPPNPKNCATNDAPTVAGMTIVLEKLLQTSYGSAAQRSAWTELQKAVPDLPTATVKNETRLMPCEICPPKTSNVENPELYPVHPYRLITAGRDKTKLQPAINAYAVRKFPSDEGWNQCIMDAAMLGDAAEFMKLAEARAAVKPAVGYRFPAFMPHLQDYEPSADHLATLNNAVTYAVVQGDEKATNGLVLLPAWPCAWDVDFVVHGPSNTTVTGRLENGRLSYIVAPPNRAMYVRAEACQN